MPMSMAPVRRASLHTSTFTMILPAIESKAISIGLAARWPTDFALQYHIHIRAPNLIDRFKVRTLPGP
jgi:hypothetical protein